MVEEMQIERAKKVSYILKEKKFTPWRGKMNSDVQKGNSVFQVESMLEKIKSSTTEHNLSEEN